MSLKMLDEIMTGTPETIALAEIQQTLDSTGSTWMQSTGQEKYLLGREGCESLAVAEERGVLFLGTSQARSEAYLANWILARLSQSVIGDSIIPGCALTNQQSEAALLVMNSTVSCLSGLPGTGKTHTMKAVYLSLSKSGKRVIGCAFTGVAAKRLQDTTGIRSTTIHRVLGYNGKDFTVTSIPCDVLVVDESSMTTPSLILSLVSRLPPWGRIILVGDPNQIPSTDGGKVLRDLCDSGVVPYYHLTEVHRQAEDSPIGHCAADILSGKIPHTEQGVSGTGVFIVECDSVSIPSRGKRPRNHPLSIAEQISSKYGDKLHTICTLAYSNQCVDRINESFRFRKIISPTPCICIKNNTELEIYNGTVGIRDGICQVFGGKFVRLPKHQVRDAWAVTVHKKQGDECNSGTVVVEPFCDRQILYTAVTRYKKRLVLCCLGGMDSLYRCINNEPKPRETLLAEFLRKEANLLEDSR